jgi:hypothetical protein
VTESGRWSLFTERAVCPLSRLSPSYLAVILYATAANGGKEPRTTNAAFEPNVSSQLHYCFQALNEHWRIHVGS